ncbi:MAG: glutamine synthetase adenylyltransferase [Planctomycetaceae bacterium]|nr:glutamine synthetase adenylyltransferase [Planctomycetaceae bacterium]
MCTNDPCQEPLAGFLPMLLYSLTDAAAPDGSLINFERYALTVPDRRELFEFLNSNPRAVEILVKLFVGSQFLTGILLRNPEYLEKLTHHKRLAEVKSETEFFEEGLEAAGSGSLVSQLDALRRYQKWELLRIGACDAFRLMDLRTVTLQLSLLADSLVQVCLQLVSADLNIQPDDFVVLAFGKLGGEELNYSSDIDLVFLSESGASRYWPLGQKLIKALMEPTAEGFLYRVDMRLRPWGRSGALVNTTAAHLDYLRNHGMQWERQAMLKARPVAGRLELGGQFLEAAESIILQASPEDVRSNIREMKEKIEEGLRRQGRSWGQVKSGPGSIRDVEFVVQGLQMIHGREQPRVRSIGTLEGLNRLADFSYLPADEYRHLRSGYIFLRTIEHALQLMHHKQTSVLPDSPRELGWLARRLDFPDGDQFVAHYNRHCTAIRQIFERCFIEQPAEAAGSESGGSQQPVDHRWLMESSYLTTFSEEEIHRHAELLSSLTDEMPVLVEASPGEDGLWRMTIVGFDHLGDLSRVCGLLFVYGFNIVEGFVFTEGQQSAEGRPDPGSFSSLRAGGLGEEAARSPTEHRKFVNVFLVRPPQSELMSEIFEKYQSDLSELIQLVRNGEEGEAASHLARRVARGLPDAADSEGETVLLPVEVEVDNSLSERSTALRIYAEDTIGFLYELTNALAVAGFQIDRVIVRSQGNSVADTLFVTDPAGGRITDPQRQSELRAAVVLIKHFTHLLPRSPNPVSAQLHFRQFLQQLFSQSGWLQELSSLERPAVLQALARLLGVSDFLWEDFLRLQHENLFPLIRDVEALSHRVTREEMSREVAAELADATDAEDRAERLNAFKDRAMFRADMRHIMGYSKEFGSFSAELTDLAEVVVQTALEMVLEELTERYGQPQTANGDPCEVAVCALGKCGGRELGFASDIELLFVYQDTGSTTGPQVISANEFYQKLVERFRQVIRARREGIFQIDLRLRPFGRAGSLAITLETFRTYYAPEGPAWPYERQALVKLRPIAGSVEFGEQVVAARNHLIYEQMAFDPLAMQAMRERQISQLVTGGVINAKLGPGGLVDTEYLIQGLQLQHGRTRPELRSTNTLESMDRLAAAGILTEEAHQRLREACIFQRRLIDALRMVRGNALDLTVPPADSDSFEFLARRLGYGSTTDQLSADIERHTEFVRELNQQLIPPKAH